MANKDLNHADQHPEPNIVYNFYWPSNISISSSGGAQSVSLPSQGDEAALFHFLQVAGIPLRDLGLLASALADDRAEQAEVDPPQPGPRVRDWMTKLGASITAGTISGAVVEAMKSFFHG